jgi:hypothetical protein
MRENLLKHLPASSSSSTSRGNQWKELTIAEAFAATLATGALLLIVFARLTVRFASDAVPQLHVVEFFRDPTPFQMTTNKYAVDSFLKNQFAISRHIYTSSRTAFVPFQNTHVQFTDSTSPELVFRQHILDHYFNGTPAAYLFLSEPINDKRTMHTIRRTGLKNRFLPFGKNIFATSAFISTFQPAVFEKEEDASLMQTLQDPETFANPQPRSANNIFIFWDKGWKDAPYLAHVSLQSWRHHNPSWDLYLLDDSNIAAYVDRSVIRTVSAQKHMKVQAKTDLYRLNLLKNYGGVWTDASILCFQPLENFAATTSSSTNESAALFAFHGYGTWPPPKKNAEEKWPAIWFMFAREAHSVVFEAWAQAAEAFWAERVRKKYPYFWLDELFREVYAANETVAAAWDAVNVMSASEAMRYSENMKREANARYFQSYETPTVLKLSFKHIPYTYHQRRLPPKFLRSIAYDLITKATS